MKTFFHQTIPNQQPKLSSVGVHVRTIFHGVRASFIGKSHLVDADHPRKRVDGSIKKFGILLSNKASIENGFDCLDKMKQVDIVVRYGCGGFGHVHELLNTYYKNVLSQEKN